MSDSNLTALAYVPETVWGTTPTTPSLAAIRFTKESLDHEKSTVESAIIRSDRMIDDLVEVGVQAKGGFDFELSVAEWNDFFEAALFGTFSTGMLKNGTTRKSMTLEKTLIAGTSYVSFTGCMVDSLALNFNSRQIITGSVAWIGKTAASAGASLDASGYTAAGTGAILSASANVGTLTVDGVAASGVKSLSFTVNNNLRGLDVIGQKELDGVGLGSCKVTGKMEVYFANRTLLEKFLNHQTAAISLSATSAGVGYTFTLPRIQFSKGMPMIPGKDQDIMLPLEFEAIRDNTNNAQVIIAEV